MYKFRPAVKNNMMTSIPTYEGERIEQKIERIVSNKEPIKDGSPEIFTSRADGVVAAYNIRTDRWEIAAEAMDKVTASMYAKRESVGKLGDDKEAKLIDGGKDEGKTAAKQSSDEGGSSSDGGAKSVQGKGGE